MIETLPFPFIVSLRTMWQLGKVVADLDHVRTEFRQLYDNPWIHVPTDDVHMLPGNKDERYDYFMEQQENQIVNPVVQKKRDCRINMQNEYNRESVMKEGKEEVEQEPQIGDISEPWRGMMMKIVQGAMAVAPKGQDGVGQLEQKYEMRVTLKNPEQKPIVSRAYPLSMEQ